MDGPPAFGHEDSCAAIRAVPALAGRPAPSYSLFLDEIDRPADQETARRWEHQLGVTMHLIERIALAVCTSDERLLLTL